MAVARRYKQIYGGRDPQDAPAYRITDAARYLSLPASTLRWWVLGGTYHTRGGVDESAPIIELADQARKLLSFRNLVEAHVLSALRREHNLLLPAVRHSVDYMKRQYGTRHPLSDHQLETGGGSLFVRQYVSLTDVSKDGQIVMADMLDKHVRRVEWDPEGLLVGLHPIVSGRVEGPKIVVIDPLMGFGLPTIRKTGIRTDVLASRFRGGDSREALARDYELSEDDILEALRYEKVA